MKENNSFSNFTANEEPTIYNPKVLVAYDHCFHKKVEISNQLFNKNYKAIQQACFKVGFGFKVWCPIISTRDEKFNSISQIYKKGRNTYDEATGIITSEYEFESGYTVDDFKDLNETIFTLVFGHYLKNNGLLTAGYYFLGQFKDEKNILPSNISYCTRISTELDLSPWIS